jgi:hypothetical protein
LLAFATPLYASELIILSATWIAKSTRVMDAHRLLRWSIVLAFGVVWTILVSPSRVTGFDDVPIVSSATPIHLLATDVSSTANETPSAQAGVRCDSRDADLIADMASKHSSLANLVMREMASRRSAGKRLCSRDDQVQRELAKAIECRQRQTSAANALKLHYGIAASLEGIRLSQDTLTYIDTQSGVQQSLVDDGVPISDPTLLDRTRLDVADQYLATQSRLSQLRIQLSQLVGSEVACHHAPQFAPTIEPRDCDVCEYVDAAHRNRCDLTSLHRLRRCLDESDLKAWETIAAETIGLPQGETARRAWASPWLSNRNDAMAHRRAWLDSLIAQRTQQITVEVELAFEKKRAAALRWTNANSVVENWAYRVTQLEKLAELRGNLADQIEAQLNRRRAESLVVQRWFDWHEAAVELELAVGCR